MNKLKFAIYIYIICNYIIYAIYYNMQYLSTNRSDIEVWHVEVDKMLLVFENRYSVKG